MELVRCTALLYGAVGSATPAINCHTACGEWAVQLMQCTATPPGGRGQWNSYSGLPHCLGAVGIASSCNRLPHCLGAAGNRTPATHYLTAWGQ